MPVEAEIHIEPGQRAPRRALGLEPIEKAPSPQLAAWVSESHIGQVKDLTEPNFKN
jgi:hypothetical protein